MDQYWYCGILVKGMETVYSYISDSGKIPTGSYVMVPFGSHNAPKIGIVKAVSQFNSSMRFFTSSSIFIHFLFTSLSGCSQF